VRCIFVWETNETGFKYIILIVIFLGTKNFNSRGRKLIQRAF